MSNIRIKDLIEVTEIEDDDYLIIDGETGGTSKILASNIGGKGYKFTYTATGSTSSWQYRITSGFEDLTPDEILSARFYFVRADGSYIVPTSSFYARDAGSYLQYTLNFPSTIYPNAGDTLVAITPFNIEGAFIVSH